MKLTCDIVQDLLPLYEEGLCSEASRAAVEEHLEECASCRNLQNSMREFKEPGLPNAMIRQEDKAIVKSFRKIHRRWFASLLAVLLAVPIVLMSVNQVRQEGICFTNLNEIWLVSRYVHALEQGNFEKAASYMDYEYLYDEIQSLLCREQEDFEAGKERMETEALDTYNYIQEKYGAVADMTAEEFEVSMQEYYTEQLKECFGKGYSAEVTGFDEGYYVEENGNWIIGYGMSVSYNKNNYPLTAYFSVRDGKIKNLVALSYKTKYSDEDNFTEALILSYPD